MKYILIPLHLIFILQALTAQTNNIPEIVGLAGAERIFNSFQNFGSDRTFEDKPDSIKLIGFHENYPTEPIYYSLKYEGNDIAQIIYRIYSFVRQIDYTYNNDGFVTDAIVYETSGGTASEIRRYKYHYQNNNFLDCIKVIVENKVIQGDSISLEFAGNKVVSWKSLRFSNPTWEIETEITEVTFDGEELKSFLTTGMVYGIDPSYNYRYSNLEKLNSQNIDIFHEALPNRFNENITSTVLGPKDAAEFMLPYPIGAEIVKINLQTGEETLVQKSKIVENGPSATIDYFDEDEPSEVKYSASYDFDNDGKLGHWIAYINSQPERRFEYNQQGRLVKDIVWSGGFESNYGTDYIYEYNADDKLAFYTHIYKSSIDTTLYDEYYFYYNGSLKNKAIEKEQITIYPNPVGDILKINSLSAPINIEITDVSGRTVLRSTASKNIDIMHLTSGTYFAKVETNKGTSIIKFIKQ